MKQTILTKLKAVEQEHNVRILYACEAGSRAWGFESPDSDYDVRFIYTHPQEWYMRFDVEKSRSVIECPIVDLIDCGGWDVRKALYLFTRTNGALIEWLNSPIRYLERGSFAKSLRKFVPTAMNETALCCHYYHLSKSNAAEHLSGAEVKLKKYLYVIRGLLAIRHIADNGSPPPVAFDALVASAAPSRIRSEIAALLAQKRNTPELTLCRRMLRIDSFVKAEIERHAEGFSGQGRPDLLKSQSVRDVLNGVFKAAIK